MAIPSKPDRVWPIWYGVYPIFRPMEPGMVGEVKYLVSYDSTNCNQESTFCNNDNYNQTYQL